MLDAFKSTIIFRLYLNITKNVEKKFIHGYFCERWTAHDILGGIYYSLRDFQLNIPFSYFKTY